MRFTPSAPLTCPILATDCRNTFSAARSACARKNSWSGLLASPRDNGALPAEVRIDPLPTYYPKLCELITRVMRRPDRVM